MQVLPELEPSALHLLYELMVVVIVMAMLMTGLLFLVNKVFKKKKLTYSDGPREVDVSWADINVGRLEV